MKRKKLQRLTLLLFLLLLAANLADFMIGRNPVTEVTTSGVIPSNQLRDAKSLRNHQSKDAVSDVAEHYTGGMGGGGLEHTAAALQRLVDEQPSLSGLSTGPDFPLYDQASYPTLDDPDPLFTATWDEGSNPFGEHAGIYPGSMWWGSRYSNDPVGNSVSNPMSEVPGAVNAAPEPAVVPEPATGLLVFAGGVLGAALKMRAVGKKSRRSVDNSGHAGRS